MESPRTERSDRNAGPIAFTSPTDLHGNPLTVGAAEAAAGHDGWAATHRGRRRTRLGGRRKRCEKMFVRERRQTRNGCDDSELT